MGKRKRYLPKMEIDISRRDRQNTKPLVGVAVDDLEVNVSSRFVAAVNEDLDERGRVRAGDITGTISHAKTTYVKVRNVRIQTAETAVAHTLGTVPLYYHVNVKSTGYLNSAPSVWETREADTTAIYLQADSEAYVDVIIRG